MRLILIILLLIGQANAATYYVKVAGGTGTGADDANAWSYAKFNSTNISSGDVVYFKKGEIFYGYMKTTAGVRYDAYGTGARPVISGFTTLPTWTSLGNNLWSASLSAGVTETMVVVNGTLTPPGRFPNTGWLPMLTGGSNSFTTDTPSPSTYNGGNAVIWKREWMIDKCPITSVSGTTVNFNNPTPFPALGPEAGGYWKYFITDHPATLDLQNEWYYTSGTLTMYSTVNPGTLGVRAATVDTLVKMGSQSNIRFENLTFEGSKESLIVISGGSGNVVTNCTLRFAGRRGIQADFMANFLMSNCDVRYINWSGVDAILGSNQRFVNNTFEYIGINPELCQPGNKANHALWYNGTNNVAEYNIVGWIGYVAIDLSGNYDTCRFNYVHDYTQMVTDGGGIYMSDETNGVGRMVYGNIVINGKGERSGTPFPSYDNSQALYFDESTAGVEVLNNFAAYNAGGGLYLHKAHHIVVRGNTFYGNTKRQVYFGEDSEGDTHITNVDFSNNVLHSLTSTDLSYSFRATPTISTFFSRISDNIVSKPSTTDSIVYALQITITGYDGEGHPIYAYDEPVYTLASWKSAYPGFDARTTGTPTAFATGTPVVQFNPLLTSTAYSNAGVYKSIKGTVYSIGTSFVRPYGNEVIIKTGDLSVVTTPPVKALRIR